MYTKGPWKHDEKWGLIMHGKTEICALHSGNRDNARLITQAPEMHQAIANALVLLNDFIEDYADDENTWPEVHMAVSDLASAYIPKESFA